MLQGRRRCSAWRTEIGIGVDMELIASRGGKGLRRVVPPYIGLRDYVG